MRYRDTGIQGYRDTEDTKVTGIPENTGIQEIQEIQVIQKKQGAIQGGLFCALNITGDMKKILVY